jgi:hypothetical protein
MLESTFSGLRRCAGIAALAAWTLLAAPMARAVNYTDIWLNPNEAGWGVNVVQSDDFMFLTFFIYGQDRKPTWYTAQLLLDANGVFAGSLFLTSGSYYALPWNTADSTPAQRVGSVQFAPSSANAYEATLTYVVDGVGTVIKAIQRQSLTIIGLGGEYIGGLSGVQFSCNNSANNGTFTIPHTLQVTHTAAGVATFAFTFPTFSCALSGGLVLHGSMYTITGATYQCVQNGATVFASAANMSEIKSTGQGIEGRWAASTGDGCHESARFSAVLQ